MKSITESQPALDLGYLHAASVLVSQDKDLPIEFTLVGCGGTGSFMALHLARLMVRVAGDGTQDARDSI